MNCPDCGGAMWDNRDSKKNPRSPDWKCKNKACGKGVWLADGEVQDEPRPQPSPPRSASALGGLTAQQQANARQLVRETYMSTMAYVAGAMQKISKDAGALPLDMGHVQAATFSVYKIMADKGLIPSHLAAPAVKPAPKREPEPARRAPEPPPLDDSDYPEALRDEPSLLPF